MLGYRIAFSMMAMIRHGSHELIRPLPSGVMTPFAGERYDLFGGPGMVG